MPRDNLDDDYDDVDDVEDEFEDEAYDEGDDSSGEPKASLSERIGIASVRPGEHDIIRSPVVLILVGGCMVLLLVAAIYGFMILRASAQREFDAAEDEMEGGKYTQAIELFTTFLETHPESHALAEPAQIMRGKCRILKEISGSTPGWKLGLEELNDFIRFHRDLESFGDEHDEVRKYAVQITEGASKQARAQRGDGLLKTAPGLLKISGEALAVVKKFSPQDEPPTELERELRVNQRATEAQIRRQQTLVDALAVIEQMLKDKQPVNALEERRKLLERYDDLTDEPRVKALMVRTIDTEKSLISVNSESKVGIKEPRAITGDDALFLTIRTQTEPRQRGKRILIAVGKNCCYGIDMQTGDPVWRQVVGLNPPFPPQEVQTREPAILVFNSTHNELMLLNRDTGKLIWRQVIAEGVSGPPVVRETQIYLTSRDRQLYNINLESGRIVARVVFSQPILSPPVLWENRLFVWGQESIVYTLTLRPLACENVTYLGHKPGTISTPMLNEGTLFLMAENRESRNCTLRILRGDVDSGSLSEVAAVQVEGQVRDRPVLWGSQLIVPSTGQRLAAFSLSDDVDSPAITEVAKTQVEAQYDGPMFLNRGPDNQLWVASDALRKLEVRERTINLDPVTAAEGLSTQPIQRMGDHVYVSRRQPFTEAVFFEQRDSDKLTGFWRTVLGSEVLEITSGAATSVVCVTESGHICRVMSRELQAGGFKLDSLLQLKLPENLLEPLRAVRFADGKLAVYCEGEESKLWLLRAQGQVERTLTLKEPLQTAPVPLSTGLLAAVAGKLKLVGRPSGSARVQDYVAPVEQGQQHKWKFVAAVDKLTAVAVDDRGKLIKIQYRTAPVPHLAEVSKMTFDQPVDVPPAVDGGQIVLADARGTVSILDAANFETLATAKMDHPASNSVWVVGDRVLVEIGSRELHCLSRKLEPQWKVTLNNEGLAGAPVLVGDSLVMLGVGGGLKSVNFQSGEVEQEHNLGQPFGRGPFVFGDMVLAPSIDGCFHRLETLMKSE